MIIPVHFEYIFIQPIYSYNKNKFQSETVLNNNRYIFFLISVSM